MNVVVNIIQFQGIQLYIEIQDRDIFSGTDDFIDAILIDHNLAVGETAQSRNYTGIFRFSTMVLGITVLCAQNFQGADCTQCTQDGFIGPNCDQINTIDDCVGVDCGNGQCVDGINYFRCICHPDFTGIFCEINIDDCVGVDCSGNGQCVDGVNNFTCN